MTGVGGAHSPARAAALAWHCKCTILLWRSLGMSAPSLLKLVKLWCPAMQGTAPPVTAHTHRWQPCSVCQPCTLWAATCHCFSQGKEHGYGLCCLANTHFRYESCTLLEGPSTVSVFPWERKPAGLLLPWDQLLWFWLGQLWSSCSWWLVVLGFSHIILLPLPWQHQCHVSLSCESCPLLEGPSIALASLQFHVRVKLSLKPNVTKWFVLTWIVIAVAVIILSDRNGYVPRIGGKGECQYYLLAAVFVFIILIIIEGTTRTWNLKAQCVPTQPKSSAIPKKLTKYVKK